ncbi:MAG: HypC/HybG/HupF family hydrogenase formation chaperone [Candidatus Hydrogenedentes bacterium]|nr:HypC/HybG/HupF family hydrogenase formation chaperone [Candidatus Hydrogenedentota bacterium]
MCLAVPGEILSIDEGDPILRKARVSFGGMVKEVSLALLPEASEGQYVLVHAGVGISIVNDAEAERIFDYLDQLGELEESGGASS